MPQKPECKNWRLTTSEGFQILNTQHHSTHFVAYIPVMSALLICANCLNHCSWQHLAVVSQFVFGPKFLLGDCVNGYRQQCQHTQCDRVIATQALQALCQRVFRSGSPEEPTQSRPPQQRCGTRPGPKRSGLDLFSRKPMEFMDFRAILRVLK